jgi:hypothetical protein
MKQGTPEKIRGTTKKKILEGKKQKQNRTLSLLEALTDFTNWDAKETPLQRHNNLGKLKTKSPGKTKKAAVVSTRDQRQKHTIENAKVVWKSKVTLKLCALN